MTILLGRSSPGWYSLRPFFKAFKGPDSGP